MAIIDLPTTAGFIGATFSLELDVSESGYQGFYTGNRQRQSTLSDRLTGVLTLPPTSDLTLQAQREALIFGLRSAGDLLRMQMPHRKSTLGTISGTVTAGANAAAGARSLTLAGVLARPNLLTNSSFEIDTNVDGLADGWTVYQAGTVGTVVRSLSTTAPAHGTKRQRITATTLGSTSGDQVGVLQSVTGIVGGAQYTLSAYMASLDAAPALGSLYVGWYAAGTSFISASSLGSIAMTGTLNRSILTAAAPALAVSATVYLWLHSATGGPAAAIFDFDAVQFEQAAAVTDYAGYATMLAGSIIGTGGNLLLVGFAGATALDSGAMTVPLSLPLPAAVTAGAAVSLSPTGLWEWDGDAPQFMYSPGQAQGPVTIPLRQSIA